MPAAKTVTYKGKEILEIHFEGLSPEQALEAMAEVQEVIASKEPRSVLALTDVTDGQFDSRVNKALAAYIRHNRPYVRKSAVLGIKGLQRTVLTGVRIVAGRDIRAFDVRQEALDWLVSD